MPISRDEATVDLVRSKRRKTRQQRLPMPAHAAGLLHHLVENTGQWTVARQQRRNVVLIESAVADHVIIRPESAV